MAQATLSKKFKGLARVEFETKAALSAAVATLWDDFRYTT